MQEHEGWLTHLSPGVVSQLEIPLANHLQYKRKVKAVKTLTYILRISFIGKTTYYHRARRTDAEPTNKAINRGLLWM